jgi:hypothetical protein
VSCPRCPTCGQRLPVTTLENRAAAELEALKAWCAEERRAVHPIGDCVDEETAAFLVHRDPETLRIHWRHNGPLRPHHVIRGRAYYSLADVAMLRVSEK